jgi:hypothetical protein
MKKALLVCLGVMLFGMSASAQYGRRGPGGMGLVNRALRDLDSASPRARGHHGTFDQARKDLLRFREHLAEGRFDKDRLDGAIENIDRLAHSDQVHPRDRRILDRDANDLRYLREHHDERERERWR